MLLKQLLEQLAAAVEAEAQRRAEEPLRESGLPTPAASFTF